METKEYIMPTHIVAVAGIVLNDRNEILMVKTHRSGWVFPGGQVEVGENLIDALKREIMEEAGIERFKAYLEYTGRPAYLEYLTKPSFKLKLKTKF